MASPPRSCLVEEGCPLVRVCEYCTPLWQPPNKFSTLVFAFGVRGREESRSYAGELLFTDLVHSIWVGYISKWVCVKCLAWCPPPHSLQMFTWQWLCTAIFFSVASHHCPPFCGATVLVTSTVMKMVCLCHPVSYPLAFWTYWAFDIPVCFFWCWRPNLIGVKCCFAEELHFWLQLFLNVA